MAEKQMEHNAECKSEGHRELRNYESQMLGDYNGLHVLATGAAQNLST